MSKECLHTNEYPIKEEGLHLHVYCPDCGIVHVIEAIIYNLEKSMQARNIEYKFRKIHKN